MKLMSELLGCFAISVIALHKFPHFLRSPRGGVSPTRASNSSSRAASPSGAFGPQAQQRYQWSTCGSTSGCTTASDDVDVDEEVVDSQEKLRVCILGYAGVGKTSLVNQFLTSEYLNTYDKSIGKNWELNGSLSWMGVVQKCRRARGCLAYLLSDTYLIMSRWWWRGKFGLFSEP